MFAKGHLPRAWGLALASAVLVVGAVGCESEFDENWNAPLDIVGPYTVGGDMLYLNRTFGEVIRLDPQRDGDQIALEMSRAPTGLEPGVNAVSADGTEFYVLNRGDETLTIVDLTSDELEATTIELESNYDRITVDPEGEFLLLSFTGASNDNVIARNLNEVGIVDLRQSTPTARFVTLSSRAQQLVFAEPFELGGEPQRLVAALAGSEITLLDLLVAPGTDEEDVLREIPLTISEAEATRTPTQALFDLTPNENQPDTVHLYALTDIGDDVTEISIKPSTREDSPYKFELSINQLAAGNNPSAMALLELPDRNTRILTLDGSAPRFTIVDVVSGEGATFSLPMNTPARGVEIYTATRFEGAEEVPEIRALAYSTQSALVSIIRPETIAISGDQPTLGRSVEAIRLESFPARVEMDTQGRERAVVFHSGLTGGFTVLDLRENRDIPIQGYSLRDIYFDQTLAYGVFNGAANLGVFDLQTGHPTVFDLPLQGQHVTVDDEDGLVLVAHESEAGNFTLLDFEEPTPENARVWRDVFLTKVLDEGTTRAQSAEEEQE